MRHLVGIGQIEVWGLDRGLSIVDVYSRFAFFPLFFSSFFLFFVVVADCCCILFALLLHFVCVLSVYSALGALTAVICPRFDQAMSVVPSSGGLKVFDLDFGRIAILICFDVRISTHLIRLSKLRSIRPACLR